MRTLPKQLIQLSTISLIVLSQVTLGLAQDYYFRRVPGDNEVIHRFNPKDQTPLDHRSIRLLVWNLYKGDRASWKRDFLQLSSNRDILLLQEFYLNQQMETTFADLLEFDFICATSFILKRYGKEISTGVATAATSAPLSYRYLRSPDLEPIIKTPKMLLFTTYPLTGPQPQLLVVNIHGINFVNSQALSRQLEQAAAEIESFEGPVVFAGDFNTWSANKREVLVAITKRLGMSEVLFSPDTRMLVLGRPVDYIYLRGLEAVNSKVYGDIDGSDHFALAAELKVSL
ncbi:MAG: endonuclease/exonuclease/phosphatase family protein [Bdellovibrionales bacterium]|jgi:endonuclease/exonuclease/phosphatase (EEP) superfamily protein YafD|nr:endonuclease/exonuclease/phosphatase family protein [Bdellovibrionales bacterium]MBT3525632.1 endonuclease/exonuclease/phosphatase family protein [Bdellovibrionales bacterium]MBT7767308.1 endonuclease/exonuclease/phosphatase family protein [Bdellovibrionales bacterium]